MNNLLYRFGKKYEKYARPHARNILLRALIYRALQRILEADRCVMQRYGNESVVVAIATLFNNSKMAGTLEQEAFEKNIDENEQKNPLPYNCLADFSTILSGINKNFLKSLLETLDKVYKPKSNEQIVISLVLQALLDTCKTKVVDDFIQSVLIKTCSRLFSPDRSCTSCSESSS